MQWLEEDKMIKCCLGKHLSVISEHLPKQNGTWSENRKLHKRHSSKTNIPSYLPIATSEIEHGHGCLLPLRRLEDPTREANWIFSFNLNNKVWGKRQTAVLVPIWWPDEGLQCPPHSTACASMRGESGGLPWLVAVKTDEAMVLGLGPLGSLQGAHYWAGILGLHHRWHVTAESAGMVESVSLFAPKVEQLTSEAVFEMFKAVDQVIQ